MIKHDAMIFPHTALKYFSYSMPHLLYVKPILNILGSLACDGSLSCLIPNNMKLFLFLSNQYSLQDS